MKDLLIFVNLTILVIMTIAYLYQIFFILAGIILKYKNNNKQENDNDVLLNRYACIISARNEENVIRQLIESLKNQNYPKDLLDIYVIADNCNDRTGLYARLAGANVITRNNDKLCGKGYALDFFFKKMEEKYDEIPYAGYFVFDADNIIDANFVREMNKVYNQGYDAITSYRNSKNFEDNWISSGYSIWFLREARFLNYPRNHFKTTCAISGTGFFVSSKLIKENGGWPYHLLTEDIEFSVNCALNGHLIGYCDKAIIYDEQPTTFEQSWHQRLRWSKGFYQINLKYTLDLIKGIFTNKKHKFSCYDLLMTTAPSMFLTLFAVIFNFVIMLLVIMQPSYLRAEIIDITFNYIVWCVINFYLLMYVCGAITVAFEWKNIRATNFNKIFYTFTFPLFMMTYVPIAIVALFKKVEWKQIKHFASDNANTF